MSLNASRVLVHKFIEAHPAQVISVLDSLPPKEIYQLFDFDFPLDVERILEKLNPDLSAHTIELFSDKEFSLIAPTIETTRLATLLSRLNSSKRATLLSLLPKPLKEEIYSILSFPSDRAGSLMDPLVTYFRMEDTVAEALDRLRAFPDRPVMDLCIVDESGKLQGTLPLQSVVSAPAEKFLKEFKTEFNLLRTSSMNPKDEVIELLERHKLSSLAVTDSEGVLVGVIRYETLFATVQQNALSDMQSMVGAGSEEKALSSVTFAISKRLLWLEVNLLTTFLASAVISLFEDTISKITALAVLLPVVAGQSGNSGSQAQAVTIRGLALREVRSSQALRVIGKEALVGLINGIIIGLTCAFCVYIWSHSLGLSLVIGLAMIVAMLAAGVAGAAIPMILTAFKQDPAQSSSILLTTVTDVVGFLTFLGLAKLFSSLLL